MTGLDVNHVTASFGGGAGIAARRIHEACVASGVASRMTVMQGEAGPGIEIYPPRRTLSRTIQRELARHVRRRYAGQVDGLSSLALPASGLAAHLNRQAGQILNLHWINSDMISIAEIGRLTSPVVWTLHDMWPFCGAEHYTVASRWQDGYATRKAEGWDLNAWVWSRKARHWRRPFSVVTPSRWLAECARSSALMRDWPVHVIPNAIDTDKWAPMPMAQARQALDLPADVPLVLFGAMGGSSDARKGFRHLRDALLRLHADGRTMHLLVFGGGDEDMGLPFPVHFAGEVRDVDALRRIYAAADVFALPSLQDNLPNTGVEALACGTPMVGFDIGGLPDLVPDRDVGYLAQPFDDEELANGLGAVLDRQCGDPERGSESGTAMARSARSHATRTYAAPLVAGQYLDLYRDIRDQG